MNLGIMRRMNAKRITELARVLAQIRGGAIYTLIACATLASALYSCSEPPAPQQPIHPTSTAAVAAATPAAVAATPAQTSHALYVPTIALIAPTPVTATPTPLPPTASRPTRPPSPTPETPTDQQTAPPPTAPIPTPTPVPAYVLLPADAKFTQIAAGKYHACGLQTDGTALCWGSNINGSLKIPGGNPTLSRISAGNNFTCGLRNDGAIACWGEDGRGQASPPDGRFDEIAAGGFHACALDDGALICWGKAFPESGEVIQEMPPLESIQAGGGFTCGLTPGADMACLNNDNREIAITLGPFISLGVGLHHTCAIRVDGSVFCSGVHYSRRSSPPSTKFAQISGGWHHACGITEKSDIECWGSGARGASGERLSAPEGEFTAISIGWRNSCALRPDGHATCWRQSDFHNLSELPEAFGGVKFEQPVELFPLPDGSLAIAERKGLIASYSDEPNAAHPKAMLDLTDKTIFCIGESGMFSAALDPQFEEFPFLYVYYRLASRHAHGENIQGLTSRLARFRVKSGRAIRDSELTILEMPQPGPWHFGGAIRFGADGMLYLGIGDNTIRENAQSLDTLLGKIIRIDVRGATPEQPYRVPPDNPFVDASDTRPEIWAYGLRNPWRMDFAPDGRLFIADVGRALHEEVSIGAAGANLGWPMCEGSVCQEGVEMDAGGLTAPIFTYGREDGCAIIGGVTASQLNNGFVFGDYCSRRVWILERDDLKGWSARILAKTNRPILSFGIGADGTMYILVAFNPIIRLQLDAVGERDE